MPAFIVTALVGVVCIVLGISNMKGNISSLHSYHRNRVSEEDRIPFGRKVGLGTIIVGVAIILFSGLSAVTLYTNNDLFILIGTGILIAGIIVGLVISFKAMIKYNKGILYRNTTPTAFCSSGCTVLLVHTAQARLFDQCPVVHHRIVEPEATGKVVGFKAVPF